MNTDQELYELLDNYAKGKLSAQEVAAVEERIKTDADFRQKAEQHLTLIDNLNFYGHHNRMKQLLDDAHLELEEPKVVPISRPSALKKYWPLSAVAASVAFISILGTLYMTRSLETKQTAYYKELRRNVDQIRKSQKMMMEDLAETKEKVKPSPGKYAGTGFMVSANGYVATSYHVVKESDSIYIENEKFGSMKATIVFSDPKNDVSILKISSIDQTGLQALPYQLSTEEANLAEGVYTLGYPREDVVFGEGSISALTGYKQSTNAYQVSVPVNPGNSGGPLLNNKGDLVGMISGIETGTLGAAFAIKSTILYTVVTDSVLDSLKIPVMLPKQNTMKNSTRVQQVKRWKDYVFMVRVYKN